MSNSNKDLFDRWRDATSIKDEDDLPKRAKKILYRVLGILLIIIFSPLILLILVFAMLATV
ncbi:MAG: hypothetical protein KDB74_09870 [Flavobacteriales bacterium]|nr:hypothetical protein [Flavobacteriales bacterium]